MKAARAIIASLSEWQAEKPGRAVVARVVNLAASAASWIACACQRVEIEDDARIMIHRPTAGAQGTADTHERAAELLRAADAELLGGYQAKCGSKSTAAQLSNWFRFEKYFDAKEAVAAGLADRVVASRSKEPAEPPTPWYETVEGRQVITFNNIQRSHGRRGCTQEELELQTQLLRHENTVARIEDLKARHAEQSAHWVAQRAEREAIERQTAAAKAEREAADRERLAAIKARLDAADAAVLASQLATRKELADKLAFQRRMQATAEKSCADFNCGQDDPWTLEQTAPYRQAATRLEAELEEFDRLHPKVAARAKADEAAARAIATAKAAKQPAAAKPQAATSRLRRW